MADYDPSAQRDASQLAEDLGDLFKLDVDAVEAYGEAIERIDDPTWKAQLGQYRGDHQRHVDELESAIRALGQEPPKRSKDAKGLLIEGMTALRSALGDDQALKAMRQNEELTNRAYSKAAQKTWPADVQPIIERGFRDEQQHLSWIEQQLTVGASAGSNRFSSR